MFDSAEIDQDIDKDTWEQKLPELRAALLDTQFDLIASRKFPVILIVSGMEGAGVIDALTGANTVLDTRHAVTWALDAPSDEERQRPRMWRFWRTLPPRGDMGIYAGAWYNEPLTARVVDGSGQKAFDHELERINRLEAMLAAEGALILKFWLHLDKEAQKKRLRKLKESARTRWRVEDSPWGGSKGWKKVRDAAEHMIRVTGTAAAPWVVVNAENPYYRGLQISTTMQAAIRERLQQDEEVSTPVVPVRRPPAPKTILTELDLSQKLERDPYRKQLSRYQDRLNELLWHRKFRKHSLVLVFEGNDAAGKGGSIRRVTEFVDPRRYRVNQYAAPTEEERAQPYLWRFWRRVPRHRHIGIFDRSWYGRVLVERVEGFCSEADWRRAYGEINDFEQQMTDAGVVVVKFWLAIDKDEQKRRFEAREQTDYKRYKITDEDWRNREKWDQYAEAVCDMVDATSTDHAPWVLVEANDKRFARVKVLKTICRQLEERLDL